jgi:hypothetical protein
MIFHVRHELVTVDLAHAVALDAEVEEDSSRGRRIRIGSLTKTEIKLIARERVGRNGEPDYWPEIEEEGLHAIARERVQQLWPRGV